MTYPTPPPAVRDVLSQPDAQSVPVTPSNRLDSAWLADELHLLRLVCQITDYEVAGALAANPVIAAYWSEGPRATGLQDPVPGLQA